MTPLKPEHQGEGTYDWACRDAGCWYCKVMGLTPELPIIEHIEYKPDPVYEHELPRKARKIRVKYIKPIPTEVPKEEIWSTYKLEYLLNNYHRLSNLDLSAKLHISAYLIVVKMKEIGLKRVTNIRIAHFEREPDMLNNNYGGWF